MLLSSPDLPEYVTMLAPSQRIKLTGKFLYDYGIEHDPIEILNSTLVSPINHIGVRPVLFRQ
jgi:hypothetical protein